MGLRVLFSSNAVWTHTGYGIQAKYLLPRLQKLGHEVAQFAWYGLQGASIHAAGMRLYPGLADGFGSDVIGDHVKHFKADLVISLHDIWPLPENYRELCAPAQWAAWLPIDHAPVPEEVAKRVRVCDYPLVYSRFGKTECDAAGLCQARYFPLGVDTDVFQPGDKAAARRKLQIPADAFLVALVAANKGTPSRKAFPEQLQAFSQFRREHPEALLYLHTEASRVHDGVDFAKLLTACDIPEAAVRFVDQYAYMLLGLPDTYLATVYQAADVLLSASMSEGFGIPIIEAQACGCPVITTDATAMPELTVNGIVTAPAQRFWTPMDSWVAMPSVARIYEALEVIYRRSPAENDLRARCGRAAMVERYAWDALVRDYWQPLLAEIETRVRLERGETVLE